MRIGAPPRVALPIRLRLTLAFTALLAVVFAGFGVFVYLHLKHGLDNGIDRALEDRAGDFVTLVHHIGAAQVDPGRPPLAQGEDFTQVLDAGGDVLDAGRLMGVRSVLSPAELQRARRHRVFLQRGERFRLLAEPLPGDPGVIVVVGAALAQRERAMETLAGALLVGGPLALLLAGGSAYAFATSTLRPVEAMRRRAQTISAERANARLPLPAARDEIHRLGETLNEMLDRLELALAHERAFVADASHELRTPLAVLRMELELAHRLGASQAEHRAALASALEEVDRVAQLAEDLLVLASSDEGQLPLRRQPVDVEQLLTDVAHRFGASAHARGRSLRVVPPDGLRVEADPLRLQQALGNLVSNAIRYGAGEIVLSAEMPNANVLLHVRDEGEGFAADFLPRAFARFSRADPARGRGGTGLGLAIVAAIAQAHGGCARAANEPRGADVWLELPVEAAASDPGRSTVATRREDSADEPRSGRR